jgi:cytochrome c oxidase subunit III
MKFFRTLREKPWISQPLVAGAPAVELPAGDTTAAEVALRFVLAIVGVLFFLFIITFLARSQYPDFQALAGPPWQPFTDPGRLWMNTGVLALASIAMQLSVYASRVAKTNRAVLALSLAVFLTLAFLLAQWLLWQQLLDQGFYANRNPANSYFYLLTAVHGLHLLGGLLVLAHVVLRSWSGDDTQSLSAPLALCARYWHFLLAVWLVLFALLTSEADTINALAAMCGF